MKLKSFILSIMLLAALAGCETYRNSADINGQAQTAQARITGALSNPIAHPSHADDSVNYLEKQWVSLTPIKETTRTEVPSLNCKIHIVTNESISILEFSQVITKKCHIPVNVTPDAIAAIYNRDLSHGGTTPAIQAPGAAVTGALNASANQGQNQSQGQGNAALANEVKIDVNYDGELDGLLNMVTASKGISWKPEKDGRAVTIYAVDTRFYSINMIASDSDMKSQFQSGTAQVSGVSTSGTGGVQGGASGSGSGSSTTMQSASIATKTYLWADIKKDLDSIAPAPRNRVSVSESTGGVTVTASPDVHEAVEQYVENKNKLFGKFMTFNVEVVSVTLTNTDSLGISWTALYSSLSGKGISLTSAFNAASGAVNGAFSILNTSSSPAAGTNAIIAALNEQGTARVVRATQLPTMNLNPVATQSGSQRSYLASSQLTQTAQVGSSTSLQPGTINTGFSISMIPFVQENNQILLRMNINLSNENGAPRQFTSGGSSIELPNLSLPLNTANTIRLRTGETVLLTGQDYVDDTNTVNGEGSHDFWGLGGGINSTRQRTMLVVLITPILAAD